MLMVNTHSDIQIPIDEAIVRFNTYYIEINFNSVRFIIIVTDDTF